MRVLLVSANYAPHVGGIERFVEILARGLSSRHAVTVLCCRFGAAPLDEEPAAFRVVRIPASYVLERALDVPYPLPLPTRLFWCLRRELDRSDVVHVQDAIYATSGFALLLARRAGVASVLTQHVAFVPQGSSWLDSIQRAAIAGLGHGSRLATRVAAYNPTVAAWAERRWGLREVQVLPVGVETARRQSDRNGLRHSFDLPIERFIALFVGRDVPKKGLDVFLASADPAYELVAVTDRAGQHAGARLLPFMEPERLQDLFRCVDAFVLPSSEGEGFPLSLQEALAAGVPAIVARHPGYDRYLGEDDVLFVPRSAEDIRAALLQLAKSEQLRQKLSERSHAVAELHFGVDRFVAAYEELYEEARAAANARRS